ncbi:hypothetical protein ALC62_00363 [Cyphomyrmex costatus]|uniref:Uncharacterized protein n=1 Tax=Cyphomyrmex costatus TaxID=456900 RepID=A0A195D759_9HYME|nr:hypothetical protein ALC62_00363 [Cyphomyrmex costatus]
MTYDFNTSLLTGDAIWPPRAKLSSYQALTEAWPIFFRNHADVYGRRSLYSRLPPPKGIKTPLLERLILEK